MKSIKKIVSLLLIIITLAGLALSGCNKNT
ncbi:MAG: hypothetical protein K0R31_379, partial [Clostridiales bacterium]|nr:hypothetical protein [Clostridiales bacterium]